MNRTALITGVSGQDGWHFADLVRGAAAAPAPS